MRYIVRSGNVERQWIGMRPTEDEIAQAVADIAKVVHGEKTRRRGWADYNKRQTFSVDIILEDD